MIVTVTRTAEQGCAPKISFTVDGAPFDRAAERLTTKLSNTDAHRGSDIFQKLSKTTFYRDEGRSLITLDIDCQLTEESTTFEWTRYIAKMVKEINAAFSKKYPAIHEESTIEI